MTMELAQAMDDCSGPNYSKIAWIWIGFACNMYRPFMGGGNVNSLKLGTAYSVRIHAEIFCQKCFPASHFYY